MVCRLIQLNSSQEAFQSQILSAYQLLAGFFYTTRLIPLTQGHFALVDYDDHEKVAHYKWRYCEYDRSQYAKRHTSRKSKKHTSIFMHREIANLTNDRQIDHKNNYGLDNRKSNLRSCGQTNNNGNQRKRLNICTSNYKGVSWHKGAKKWVVQIQHKKTHSYLGLFNSEIEAAKIYDEAAKKLFGEFAKTNF